jgi:chromosome segregation ATPase
MALGDDTVGGDGQDIGDGSASEVSHSIDDLSAKVQELNAALASQDKLLRQAARERREFRSKYESMLRELESARASVVVSDKTECDECALHMSNITTLQTKYATLLDERGELRSRSSLLGACAVCPGLQSELAETNARIALLEKASSVSAPAPAQCALYESLQLALESCRHDKTRTEEENTYLRSVLSWVSSSEPQLGMMVSQFKRGTGGLGLGFAPRSGCDV